MSRFALPSLLLALLGCHEDKTDCPLCVSSKSRISYLMADPPLALKTVKLDDVLKDVASRQGKLVLVDVWADFCIPCKREFPHLVELSRKYDELACISVSVDEPKDRPATLAFLRKQKAATVTNYLLDEKATVWQEHWNITAIPAAFLYRDGKLVKRFDYDDPDNQFTYDDVEKAVVKLLSK